MRRFLLTTAMIAGLGVAAVAAPNHDGTAFWGASTETDAKPAPVLQGWVRETIAEARREADELTAMARENGVPVGPDGHEIRQTVHFRSPELVSVLREDWAYEGGANGSPWLIPVNWDARASALVPIQSVLGDPAQSQAAYDRVARLLHDATVEQVWNGHPQGWADAIDAAIEPDPMFLSTFTFVPSTVHDRIGGIAWHFEPLMVAPTSKGTQTVVIPQSKLRDLVAPEWRDLMAGEPASALNARLVVPGEDELDAILARY